MTEETDPKLIAMSKFFTVRLSDGSRITYDHNAQKAFRIPAGEHTVKPIN